MIWQIVLHTDVLYYGNAVITGVQCNDLYCVMFYDSKRQNPSSSNVGISLAGFAFANS